MKGYSNTDGRVRILNNELEIGTSNDDQSTLFDVSCWIENSILEAINETRQSVPENSIDEWAKNNRLLALSQLQSYEYSVPSSSPFSTVLSEDFSSPGLDAQLWSPLYGSSDPMNDGFVSETQFSESENCCEPTTESNDSLARLSTHHLDLSTNVKSSIGFMDAHCHIDLLFNDEKFDGTYAEYIARHKETFPDNYQGCVAVFCKPWTFSKVHMWGKHLEQPNVWGAFGCHPKQARSYNATVEKYLEQALNHPKVRALGEIGLDYSKQNWRFKKEQQHVFRRQLTIAKRRHLRVVIHCREADDDAIKIMREILPRDAVFHLHCFTSSWKKAEMWMRAFPNVYIGITNLVSFPSATDTHEVAGRLRLDRLLLETDAPFFVPRGAPEGTRFSHPGMASYVAAEVAAIRNISIDDVLKATCANTRFVYNIP